MLGVEATTKCVLILDSVESNQVFFFASMDIHECGNRLREKSDNVSSQYNHDHFELEFIPKIFAFRTWNLCERNDCLSFCKFLITLIVY